MATGLTIIVRERAGRRCEYCRIAEWMVRHPFQLDHIVAQQHGGPTHIRNLAWSCLWCNKHKGPNIAGRDSTTRSLVPLFNPRRHKWDRHFRWDDAHLVGATSIGRVTVRLLAINAAELVALRKELIKEGIFHN